MVSLANNHTLDYGQVGLADTLAAATSSGVPVVGAGTSASAAYAPWITTVKGVRIAFLGFTQITELASTWVATDTRPGLAMAIDQCPDRAGRCRRPVGQDAGRLSWWCTCTGGRSTTSARSRCRRTARPGVRRRRAPRSSSGRTRTCMQGDGWLGQTYVAYGLSNFLWWYNDAQSNDTGVHQGDPVRSDRSAKTEFLPAYIDRTTGQPIPSTGAEADPDRRQAGCPSRVHRPRRGTLVAGKHTCTRVSLVRAKSYAALRDPTPSARIRIDLRDFADQRLLGCPGCATVAFLLTVY